ncbi:MAG: hypothetical protein HOO06_07000 [Bdellovibrionaceae bacterium]|jgi:hypothetical protein|nr:hypothetical protein [Pseudobdellovibrionaceae bacterium]
MNFWKLHKVFSLLLSVYVLSTCQPILANSCKRVFQNSLENHPNTTLNWLSNLRKSNHEELKAVVDLALKSEPEGVSDKIYGFNWGGLKLNKELQLISNEFKMYLKHLGAEDIMQAMSSITAKLHGEELYISVKYDGDTPRGFAQISFKEARQLGGDPSRVYISFHPKHMKNELPFLFESSEKSGASALKFFMGEAGMTRPDRFIIAFNNPIEAINYGKKLADRYNKLGITGDRVPFTFKLSGRDNSPVSFGKDINPKFEFKSWRGRVSDTIAEAIKKGKGTPQEVREYLLKKGIDSDYWLPTKLVRKILVSLATEG